MTDTATSRNRFRKQEVGTNVNSWGTNLNEVLDAIDQTLDGVETIAITGDYTLVTTNYTTADDAKNRVLVFTGTLTANANITVPSVEHEYRVVNLTTGGFSIVVKTSGGSGVTIPNGYECNVYCDGSNVLAKPVFVNGALTVAGQIKGLSDGTANTDAVSKLQMENAIAAGGGTGAAAGTVKVDSSATAVYLIGALTASGILTITDNGNSLALGVPTIALASGGRQTGSFSAASNTKYPVALTAAATITLPASPADGDICAFAIYGEQDVTIDANGKTINGQSTLVLPAFAGVLIIHYDDTLGDWT